MWPGSAWNAAVADAYLGTTGGLAALDTSLPDEAVGPVILVAGGLAALLVFVLFAIVGSGRSDRRPDQEARSVRFPDASSEPSSPHEPEIAAASSEDPSGDPIPVAPSTEMSEPAASEPPADTVPAATATQEAETEAEAPGPPAEQGSPTWQDVMELGRIAAKGIDPSTMDDVLEAASEVGLGEPEIVSDEPGRTVVRLTACRSCREDGGPGSVARIDGCPFEAGFLEAAAAQVVQEDVAVFESACSSDGGDTCEFEIWQ